MDIYQCEWWHQWHWHPSSWIKNMFDTIGRIATRNPQQVAAGGSFAKTRSLDLHGFQAGDWLGSLGKKYTWKNMTAPWIFLDCRRWFVEWKSEHTVAKTDVRVDWSVEECIGCGGLTLVASWVDMAVVQRARGWGTNLTDLVLAKTCTLHFNKYGSSISGSHRLEIKTLLVALIFIFWFSLSYLNYFLSFFQNLWTLFSSMDICIGGAQIATIWYHKLILLAPKKLRHKAVRRKNKNSWTYRF